MACLSSVARSVFLDTRLPETRTFCDSKRARHPVAESKSNASETSHVAKQQSMFAKASLRVTVSDRLARLQAQWIFSQYTSR